MYPRLLNRAILQTVPKARAFHAGKKANSVLEADSSKSLSKMFHTSGIALVVLAPAAFVFSPSKLNVVVDLALGVLLPFHSHVACNYIISDYVPKAFRSAARGGMLFASLVAAAGILKLNIQGPGLTESVKSLWRKPTKD